MNVVLIEMVNFFLPSYYSKKMLVFQGTFHYNTWMSSKGMFKKKFPNYLTITRFIISCIVGVLIFIPDSLLIAQILITAGVVSDKLDGSLARLWDTESDLGKRLESITDPTFSLMSGIYILIHTDLPLYFFLYCFILFLITNLSRVYIKLKTGKLFYEKSQITRFGVGLIFIVILFYLYSLPYREWFLTPLMVMGAIGAMNYLRMMFLFMKRDREQNVSA